MNVSPDQLKEILGMLSQAKELRPIVTTAIDLLVDDFAPELGKLAEALRDHVVKNRIATFEQFLAAKFSREEALLLTLDVSLAAKRAGNMLGAIKTGP